MAFDIDGTFPPCTVHAPGCLLPPLHYRPPAPRGPARRQAAPSELRATAAEAEGHVMGAAQADRGVAFLTAAKVLAQSSAAADLIVVGAPRRRATSVSSSTESYMPYSTTVLTV